MPTGKSHFKEIARHFVGEFTESAGLNSILVVTDWFAKVQHYMPGKTTCAVEDVADSYINDIWKLHALLRNITSNLGSQLAPKFLKELKQQLNINLRLFTAYHPQTDRLSKQAGQTLKQWRCIYCYDRQNYHNRQYCWQACLCLADFTHNTIVTTSTNFPATKVFIALIHILFTLEMPTNSLLPL